MKKVNIKVLIILLAVFFIVLIFIWPYNIFQKFNAKNIVVNDSILLRTLDKKSIADVEYKGDDTYLIKTNKKQFVVIRENTSFMNYKWKVFEYKEELPK